MTNAPNQDSRLLRYASVAISVENGAPFTIKGVDIWDDHAVIYGEVLDPRACIDYSHPTRIEFDSDIFEIGPLTVVAGGLPSIVFATSRPPNVDAESVSVRYGDVEVKGTIAPGERP
ncbi:MULTISPECIES: hypothetical protein [Cryobacterium]|uniref:Uncharacterized protein n=1 Tax=Cryobacterium zhongshanensis TaxID=2928153 RepID=A0AA41QW27_9MICO|nr:MULTISPECIES: hypothetical protein [Cryobacterium]MCI4658514.1 hypothetical protein [Cryobacterium zhongshanensis]MDY7541813.1 hypothetical protein [Cryobacterium sp. 5B3]MEB0276364.1 hypothetical protein [Cryobacterium sp. 5B3]